MRYLRWEQVESALDARTAAQVDHPDAAFESFGAAVDEISHRRRQEIAIIVVLQQTEQLQ